MGAAEINQDITFRNAFRYSYLLLNKREKGRLKFNIILSFFAGLFEIIAVTTFYPLISFIVEPNLIETNKLINKIWTLVGSPSQTEFVIILATSASLILLFSVFLNLISQVISTRDASSAEERLSKEFYSNLIYSPYNWHLLNNPNLSRNIILNNNNIWNKSIIKVIPAMFGQLSGIGFAFFVILLTTPKLGLILLTISVLILSIFLKIVRKKSNYLMKRVRENQDIINIFISETLSGIKDIKLSSNEENFIKTFYKLNHIVIKNVSSAANWNSLPSFFVLLLGQLTILFTATLLFILGIKGGELAAIIAILVLVFLRVIPLLNKFGASFTNITNLSSYVEKIYNITNSIKKEKDSSKFFNQLKPKKSLLNWDKVIFSNVEFKYPNSQVPVFKNLNLEINKGFHYAFVGNSGSGKSTIIDLFLGLLEPSKGSIFINKLDLKEICIRDWHKKINYVPQEPLISDLSLRENIAFGIPNENIDNKRILYCLKKTDLLKVSNTLENGIYTNLGNQGISLSGGQKQRVAISRALYHDNDILILDEATSSLDSKTELIIQKTLQRLKKRMTIISIAHRFSTIKSCDCIFLLDQGKIVGKGSFEELKKRSKLFRELSTTNLS